MLTPIYLKMDAQHDLLLSEGVCRQLGIVSYHQSITIQEATKKASVNPRVTGVRARQSIFLPGIYQW